MFSRRLAAPRIPAFRPLRPPNVCPPPPPPGGPPPAPPQPLGGARRFARNTQLLLVAPRTTRPQLPYLSQPAFRVQNGGFLGPNPQLARLLSTETRKYVVEQTYLAAKWTAIIWTFLFLGGLAWAGCNAEMEERRQPTPSEWSLWSRLRLQVIREAIRNGNKDGMGGVFVDWGGVGSTLQVLLSRLEDHNVDGKGVEDIQSRQDGEPLEGVGMDISSKSWPWRSGYFDVAMMCATAAERLEGYVVDTTRGKTYSNDVVVGPSNPDPRPMPINKPPPKEEDCVPAAPPPETFYMRVLAGKGFTTRQKLEAALAYANWLEFRGRKDKAEEVYKWGVDIALKALDTPTPAEKVIDRNAFVLKPDAAAEATPNLLKATTALAVHRAKNNDVASALPILLSVLRARRSAPVSPFPQFAPEEGSKPETDIAAGLNLLRKIFVPPKFPPPPPSGDVPYVRLSDRPTCEDSELMLYIGEILFATSPKAEEGLGWTRQAVTIAEANLQPNAPKGGSGEDENATEKCKQCLTTGLENWETMLRRLATEQAAAAEREGTRNAGWLEWRGWFGRDGGSKGRVLDEAYQDMLDEHLRKVAVLKERIVQEKIAERSKGMPSTGGVWMG
jgi:hypothetical protein